MDVGIGLPTTIPGVTGAQVLEWARRAEARGFSSLGTIDRIVYPNYEPLIALAAAAAVTERIRLATTILIAPYRANGALVAKQAATLDNLSGGRLVLGVAVGGREDDYEVSGVDFHTRGKRFDAMLAEWDELWRGDRVGPPGRPTLIVGGSATPPTSGPPATATAGPSAAGRRTRSRAGWRRCGRRGARPAATASRAGWRWPTTRSATGRRRRRRATSATTTASSASTRRRSPTARRPTRTPSAATCRGSRRRAATS